MKQKIMLLFLTCSIVLTGCGKINDSSISSESISSESIAERSERENALNPATPLPTAGIFSAKQGYSDFDREVSVLGLKEYKKITGSKHTDAAEKGKTYLVLFLKVRNRTKEKIYFHVGYLSTKVDNEAIENTFLLNEPEGYPTIFSNIEEDSYYGGFIVWQVPENWKKLEVAYEGWRDSDGLILNGTFTKKDLTEPEPYNKTAYGKSG